jgi:2-keto-3-deoxy-L-rhamnonate aldolase RhmA
MTRLERRMLEILQEGRERHGFLAVKAEFEAEGTRADELLRLLEVARRAQVKVGVKIGGCEAIRDLIECRQFGVDYVIAPMIETPYALKKYIDAKNKVFPSDEREQMKFLYNIETISAYNNLKELAEVSKQPDGVDGMVFGRVDFAGSLGKTREAIQSDEITNYVVECARVCRAAGLELVCGGAVTLESAPALRRVKAVHLDRFETRKVIFSSAVLDSEGVEAALALAGEFELLWLQNKRDYYGTIAAEDAKRIAMLEARFHGKASSSRAA